MVADVLGAAAIGLGLNAVRATLLLLAALALSLAARRASAALRRQIWSVAVVGLLALPLFHTVIPRLRLALLPSSPVVSPALSWSPPEWQPSTLELAKAATVRPPDPVRVDISGGPRLPGWSWWQPGLILAWVLGGAVVACRFGRARAAARRWIAQTEPISTERGEVLTGLPARSGAHVTLPMTLGALRPVILIPAAPGAAWPSGWRAAVLAHEGAHVRAGDPMIQLLAEVALVIYWFHPLAWLAARQLRTERELAADDEVIRQGIRASDYAEVLVALSCVPTVTPTSGAVLPMLTPSGLKARLLGVLDERRPRGLGAAGRIAVMTGLACLVVPTASAVLVSRHPSGATLLACAREESSQQPSGDSEVDIWDGQIVSDRLTAGADGCVHWSGVSVSGQLVVYVRKGRLAGRQLIRLGEYGERLPVAIELRRAASVSGTVLDDAGRPRPGTVVRVVSSEMVERGPGPDSVVRSDLSGRFQVDGLMNGRYRLLLETPARGLATVPIEVRNADVTGLKIKVPEREIVTGRLLAEGRSVPNARIDALPSWPGPGREIRGRHLDWDVSRADGAFEIVPIGQRTLRAVGRTHDGRLVTGTFLDWELASLTPGPAGRFEWQVGSQHDVELQPAGLVRGVVLTAEGRPAANAWVQGLVWGERSGKATITEQSAVATTNDKGSFVLGPLPLGPVAVVASAHRWRIAEPAPQFVREDVDVSSEADRPLSLALGSGPQDESVLRQPIRRHPER